MLDSLHIKNYRNLKEFTIPSLGKVNLITGKNNTGKSTILEAIAIYAGKGDLSLIYDLLVERGEYFKQKEVNKNFTESNVVALASLFTNRLLRFDKDDSIVIGEIASTLPAEELSDEKSISFGFVRYMDEIEKDKQGNIIGRKRVKWGSSIDSSPIGYSVGLQMRIGKSSFIVPLNEERPHWFGIVNTESCQFIRPRNIDREINGKLWDNIALTDKEQDVIQALKIIEPFTERIAFVEENPGERTAKIKLSNSDTILPLRSMGDSINRVLTIILALVNAADGYLLIDEFENGLHYTVQQQLWNIVFNLARILNVQVFATTHSEDCIRGFESVLNDPALSIEGKLIRLDNKNGVIKEVEFDARELKIANNQNIEIR